MDPSLPALTIRPAEGETDLAAVRQLCWDYRAHLLQNSATDAQITQTFYPEDRYRALMETLPALHARPRGIILLALRGETPVGCAMSHALAPDLTEVKRLFVAPAARGSGAAQALMMALMAQARRDGFARMVLDTSRTLGPAQALYTAMGFRARGPYQEIPAEMLPHLLFFEATL